MGCAMVNPHLGPDCGQNAILLRQRRHVDERWLDAMRFDPRQDRRPQQLDER
jgi:hypothetical protein